MSNPEDEMKLREQFEKETGMAWINTQGEPDIEYVEWLETKLQDTSSNGDYAKCLDELKAALKWNGWGEDYTNNLIDILKKHFT